MSYIALNSCISSRCNENLLHLSECWTPAGGGVISIATAEAHQHCSRACIPWGNADCHWIRPCQANLARPCNSHSLGRDSCNFNFHGILISFSQKMARVP